MTSNAKTAAFVSLALGLAAVGARAAAIDDPSLPGIGPGGIGMLLMGLAAVLGVRAARHRLSTRAARMLLTAGVLTAGIAGFLIHMVAIAAPLFTRSQDVPSVIDSPAPPQYAAAVERARELVRAAIVAQNLPGVSVAVARGVPAGALAKEGGTIVWAEGFGWRDVDTRTLVTPSTRFNIGTAASAFSAEGATALALTNTGAESATQWSPEHVGEPEENPPAFTAIRHVVFRPIGLAPSQPLPSDRATFYVPRSGDDPRRGRRLMYMRDLACCAGTMAFYSTAADLVRVGTATRASVNGELAGGAVASLLTLRDGAIVVAVLSNVTHANTSALAVKVGNAFESVADLDLAAASK